MHPIVDIAAGLLVLLAGRKLFWLFIAVVGFLAGVELARELLLTQTEWVTWLIGAGAGIVGAVVAVLFQRVAFALAGAYAGAYLAVVLAQSLGWVPGLAVFLGGAAIGAVVAALVMDWAILVLSSLIGAGLIVATLGLASLHGVIAASVLAAVGIVFQSRTTRGRRERSSQTKA
ncbi:MAG: hypothetical protein WCE38_07760 [Burkholderiales bacterium]